MALGALRDILAGALVLGILVLFHEWGHFVVAKLCGVRVDVFSIGFGTRLWGVKRGDTDYRISALPLGGYVRMAGDNPVEERTGAPYEFLSRPRWQRFLIAIAGPAMNILVTFLIFAGIYIFAGIPVDAYLHNAANVAAVPQAASAQGLQAGDQIVQVNGANTPTWGKVLDKVNDAKPGETISLAVLRNGARQTLSVTAPDKGAQVDSVVGYPLIVPTIEEISPGSPAARAGLAPDDTIISMDGHAIVTWQQLVEGVHGSDGRAIQFVIRRDGKEVPMTITPIHTMTVSGEMAWQIGILPKSPEVFEHQGLITSAKEAGIETYIYARMIGNIFTGLFRGRLSVRDLAGPVGIVQMSGQAAKGGPMTLLNWMAYISLDLGLLNLLPIPILDGGHVLMLAIEGTIRRDLSLAFKERFVQVGLVFLLGLFAFVMYSDILRVIQAH